MTEAKKTPLYDWHAAHGGRMVEFGGWLMPVQYSSIVTEHQATRQAVGLFDISHMGRLHFVGPEGADFLNRMVTKDVEKIGPGRIRYALMTNDQGGVKDDVLVYHLTNAAKESYRVLVVNAGNREKILSWIRDHLLHDPARNDIDWFDLTGEWAMLAIQGPKALELLQPLVEVDLSSMKYYTGLETSIAGVGSVVSRTGYTGEDGFELMVGAPASVNLWEQLIERAAPLGGMAAGLGCRDTLRLEAAMPLYGHELEEDINPYQAGLSFAVDLNKTAFPGLEVLKQAGTDNSQPVRTGLEVEGKRIPRQEAAILTSDAARQIGFVTSGTSSPTLGKVIAMGFVDRTLSAEGTHLIVDIRGHQTPAKVVPLPFYKRAK